MGTKKIPTVTTSESTDKSLRARFFQGRGGGDATMDRIEELLSSPSAASWSGRSSLVKKQMRRMSPELRLIGAMIDDDECRGVANKYVQQWRAKVWTLSTA